MTTLKGYHLHNYKHIGVSTPKRYYLNTPFFKERDNYTYTQHNFNIIIMYCCTYCSIYVATAAFTAVLCTAVFIIIMFYLYCSTVNL